MSTAEGELVAMIHDYCELFDTAQFDAFADQFADGVWHKAAPGKQGVLDWLDANLVLHDGSPCTKHVTTNLVVEVDETAGTATARSYVTVLQAVPDVLPLQTVFSGRYRDRFTRVDGRWRWDERRVLGDLYGDISQHVRPSH